MAHEAIAHCVTVAEDRMLKNPATLSLDPFALLMGLALNTLWVNGSITGEYLQADGKTLQAPRKVVIATMMILSVMRDEDWTPAPEWPHAKEVMHAALIEAIGEELLDDIADEFASLVSF